MCGLFGLATMDGFPDMDIKSAINTMKHRGPDDYGDYQDQTVTLGHRRLSIIDLEGGHQPVLNHDESCVIVFNGEIYNYRDIKKELEQKGYHFSTNSDTETILHAYEEWGQECVDYLRGMFSFAIWDKHKQELFIARDRLGIKPLFYAEHNGVFYFASEMKAILNESSITKDIDELALTCYFSLSYIPAPLTIYSKIRKLLPGHTITWKNGKVTINKYWDLYFSPDRQKSEKYFLDGISQLLSEAVDGHMISDVPLGAFLSGGVDSSAIVSLMPQYTDEPVNTFCIGFGGDTGGYLDERVYAQMVAEQYHTKHREYQVEPSAEGILDKLISAFDEPFADDSLIPSYYVSKIARENVTVTLSGLGGDELFAGYERYLGFRYQSIYSKIPKFIRKSILANLINKLPERADGHYTINHLKRFVRGGALEPDQCYISYLLLLNSDIRRDFFVDKDRFDDHFQDCIRLLADYFNSENVDGPQDSVDRALYCDIKTYLPEDILALTDRVSMQHSLEVRVPFLDHKLMEFCATIPPELRLKGFNKKYLLKKAFTGRIPDEVIRHRKQGFVGPTSKWIRTDLKDYVLQTLTEDNLKKHGYINPRAVERILKEHFTGKQIHDKLIWSLVIFQKWYESNYD